MKGVTCLNVKGENSLRAYPSLFKKVTRVAPRQKEDRPLMHRSNDITCCCTSWVAAKGEAILQY